MTEREEDLVKRAKDGDELAFEKLCDRLFGMIISFCKIIRQYDENYGNEEMRQDLRIAIWQALRHYNEDKGVKFSTYAYYWIKKEFIKTGGRMFVSLDSFYEDEDGESHSFEPMISYDYSEVYHDEKFSIELSKLLDKALGKSKKKDRNYRFIWDLLHTDKSLSKLAKEYGISKQRASQIVRKYARKVFKMLMNKGGDK